MQTETQAKNLLNQNMSSEEYRHMLKNDAIKILETEKNFKILDYLGSGSYGYVVSAKSPHYKEAVAMKIVHRYDTWIGEIDFWPTLKHDNLLPLLDIMQLPNVDLFITPLLFANLENTLEDDNFKKISSGLKIVKRWLSEILDALGYLHNIRLCHLDVKADNILLDYDFKAVLCDFTFIDSTNKLVERYGMPLPYRPPETCTSWYKDIPVDGRLFDMWSYGILAFNALTGHDLKSRVHEETKRWHKEIYPLLFEALQINTFTNLMSNAFPSTKIPEEEISDALNFVYFLLRPEPKSRPSVGTTANHVFLMKGFAWMENPDDVWISGDNVAAGNGVVINAENHTEHPPSNSLIVFSDTFCPCMADTQSPMPLKKHVPRYKLRKYSPRIGRRYKMKKRWMKKKSVGHVKIPVSVISESGDTGKCDCTLKMNYRDYKTYVRLSEKNDRGLNNEAFDIDQNLDTYRRPELSQEAATIDPNLSETAENYRKGVTTDDMNNMIDKMCNVGTEPSATFVSDAIDSELPLKTSSTCDATESTNVSHKDGAILIAVREKKRKFRTWLTEQWEDLCYCFRRAAFKS